MEAFVDLEVVVRWKEGDSGVESGVVEEVLRDLVLHEPLRLCPNSGLSYNLSLILRVRLRWR